MGLVLFPSTKNQQGFYIVDFQHILNCWVSVFYRGVFWILSNIDDGTFREGSPWHASAMHSFQL